MATLDEKRHTLAHLLASAVAERYPHAKATIGPAVENGFYYDFDFTGGATPNENDLENLQEAMKEMLPQWEDMTGVEVSYRDAQDRFKGNEYKLELIEEIKDKGEKITIYTAGGFTDLCRGGHSERPATDISKDSFKLDRVAGAYWRGDEKNPMLTRIYGLAFETKKELADFETMQEEAKKRDHRKIGKEMRLFTFSDLVGPGLPLWTPRGTIIREALNDFVWELRKARGYQKVTIPHITKKNLYEKSGHWAKYADDLFRIHTREGTEYAMKPMNCPHHAQLFDSEPHSYRDMPERFAETTMVYRDEQSGELSGLSRVLSITQDDAHVFCRENQIEKEAFAIWDIIDTFYGTFGFTLTPRFSRHDPTKPEKYLNNPAMWKKAEEITLGLIQKRGVTNYIDGLGEAALYGPKIDFLAKDAIGRVHQVATIQIDFFQPENFDLVCTNEKGEKERIVMIHAAIMGSIERFLSVYIEHTSGTFPLWLSPVQVSILPVSDKQSAYAEEIFGALRNAGVRVELSEANDSLGKRIRKAKVEKVPYMIVIGDKEVEAKNLTVETRAGEKLEGLSVTEFVAKLTDEIKDRI